jgi:hypothetical protein
MPLRLLNIKPGFNKQFTASGAESQWIDGDNVRFRYGLPEKIGGWEALTFDKLIGAVRAQHIWADLNNRRYAALGSNAALFIYHEGKMYDITPIDTDLSQTGCDITTTNGSNVVTITTPVAHNLVSGRIVTFDNAGSFTSPDTDYVAADFDDVLFQIQNTTSSTFTILMPTAETGSGVTNDGTLNTLPYVYAGLPTQVSGFGWGAGRWGYETWGTPRSATDISTDPGSWSLDNYGQKLIATVHNGKTFEWDPLAVTPSALTTRATALANNPTKSVLTIVSDRDRHLFHLGTEETIGTPATQDKMLIRFSNQEDPEVYQPTATNTAGTFRLDNGTRIVGGIKNKDYLLVLTDTSCYILQFVGPPFTFSIRQVGIDCGLIGQHAITTANGAVYWMGNSGGFFVFDGTVKSLPCLVEDFVFNTSGGTPGLNYNAGEVVFAGHNSLYTELNWFYASSTSGQVNRCVTYNYAENAWTTGSLSRSTYKDKGVYNEPYATEFTAGVAPTFPIINGVSADQGNSLYFAHEIGTNAVVGGTTTAIPAYIRSGDYSMHDQGDAEFLLKVRRFIPDFKVLNGDAKVTLFFSDYPTNTAASSNTLPSITGPFTINSSTDKVDTRVRGRLVSLKIENDAVNQSWRYGTLRLDVQPDGRR